MTLREPAAAPTLYFFGVTTAKSSIMKVFPAWAKYLGLGDAVIKGVDFALHAPPPSTGRPSISSRPTRCRSAPW